MRSLLARCRRSGQRSGRSPEGTISLVALASVFVAVGLVPVPCRAHTGPGVLSLIQPPTTSLDPNITLSVGPTLLFKSGQWVTVTWTGIESWMFPDAYVAAFSPGAVLDDPARVTDVAPVKYQFLTAEQPFTGKFWEEVGDEGENGGGRYGGGAEGETGAVESLRFRLLNLRDAEGYRFGLFKGGVDNPVLVAKTEEAVTFARPFEACLVGFCVLFLKWR